EGAILMDIGASPNEDLTAGRPPHDGAGRSPEEETVFHHARAGVEGRREPHRVADTVLEAAVDDQVSAVGPEWATIGTEPHHRLAPQLAQEWDLDAEAERVDLDGERRPRTQLVHELGFVDQHDEVVRCRDHDLLPKERPAE